MATSENKLSLKVLVDSETKKVLFAEADSDFVNVLYGFLTLPVGTIIRQLEKHLTKETCGLGCLNNLYATVRNLSSSCFSTEQCKLMLLHPQNASEFECRKLKLKIDDSEPTQYFKCRSTGYDIYSMKYVSTGCTPLSTYKNVRCSCSYGAVMDVLSSVGIRNRGGSNNEIFTAGAKSFVITEDLGVIPYAKILNFQVLQNLVNGVDMDVTEEHILDVGLKEIILLLKLSLISDSPLTNFFHALRGDDSTIINPEPVFKVHSPQSLEGVKTDGSIELKALVRKLTRKALFFMGGDDFVELLFRILTIPLGSVVSLLGGSSSIGSIDNMYKSISDMSSDFFRSSTVKDLLINPKLPKHYLSTKTNKFLPVGENPVISGATVIDPKGGEGYIKSQEVYVDDLFISGSSLKSIEGFKASMSAKFEMSDLGRLSYYLGLEVMQEKTSICVKQTSYAKKILEDNGMMECNSVRVPMETSRKFSKAEDEDEVEATRYRRAIGCLRYLLHTRPDLAYYVGILSRYMQSPRTSHEQGVKHVLRYVKRTVEYGLKFTCGGSGMIIGYSDSSHNIDPDDGKSTGGHVFYYGSALISWCSHKLPTVALSSCETEFMAATSAACQAIWLQELLGELLGLASVRVVIQIDNMSAIALTKNPVFHGRNKHILSRYHFIRECVEKEQIEVEHVPGVDQKADILTKALGRVKFEEMRKKLGVEDLLNSSIGIKGVNVG